jgi:uncharacterized protein (DUF3084 family)
MSFFENLKQTATADVDALKNKVKALEAELQTKVVAALPSLEKTVEYDASAAIQSFSNEASNLKNYIQNKVASIAAHNQNILSETNIVKDLEAAKQEAEKLLTKLEAAFPEIKPASTPTVAPAPVVAPAPAVVLPAIPTPTVVATV